MIKAFLGAIAVLLAAAGAVAGPALRTHPAPVPISSAPARPHAEGTSSTPAVFTLPELGSVSFRCDRRWSVQPVFDMRLAEATDEVTIRAGAITRRNFTRKVVGRVQGRPLIEDEVSRALELALPFGHYRTVTFRVCQGTEAREADATLTADLVAGTFAVRGVPERLGACYVRRWSVRMTVSPY